ncbi:hypothetical protein [Micromonospora sp. WMMC273]|uniref:hypothetical protein n=1 Tax=Micromonospora sp. WMMC273 TaxID=3015157 RepID=UPI0022B6B83B|nr:hypothetical protein [Micromonospora sp. WMMC273]MCZ7478851.1 hypothetical protein [Micromonospora sp. WMMC273]
MISLPVAVVTTRRNARLHLAVHGRAWCGAGSGRILGPVRQLNPATAEQVCRRCSPRLTALVVEEIAEAYRRRRTSWAIALNVIADRLRTPAQAAAEEAMLAEMRARLFAPAPQPVAAVLPREEPEVDAGQLVLFPA